MDGSPARRPAPERAPEHRTAAFRISTADDYNASRQSNSKRKHGQPSTACQSCRTRKVKCIVAGLQSQTSRTAARLRCQPCRHSNLDCQWDGVDGRRRRRSRPFSTDQRTPDGQLESTAVIAETSHDMAFLEPVDSPIEMGRQGPTADDRNETSPRITRSPVGFDATQTLGSGQLLAEFCPEETVEISQDWPDLQNFILGLDFMGQNDPAQEHIEAIRIPAQGASGQSPAQRPRVIKLRYYRRFGPTAVVPGLRRLSVVVDPEQDDAATGDGQRADTECASSHWNNSSPASTTSQQSKLFDKSAREPHPDIMPRILDVFFEHFGGHFPFLNPQILGGHLRSGEASSFLLNAIAALTVRFCTFDGPLAAIQDNYDVPWRRGAPFLKKAKEQLVPLLSIPAPEVVAGLLILAWADFGDNNEAGLWMFAGMAIRMAQDLGFHRTPETDIDPNISFHDHARPSPDGRYILTDEQSTIHQQKARLVMFWSVFIMDVCVSLVTGRPPTIRRSEIEVPIPTFNDMKLAQLDFQETVSMHNMIFPETVRFMVQFSESVEALNQKAPSRSPEKQAGRTGSNREGKLSHIRQEILQSYNSLPSELVFNIENYKASSSSTQAGLFLMLHLFFYTFTTLLSNTHSRDAQHGLHHAQSRRPSANNISQVRQRSTRNIDNDHGPSIAIMACQKVIQILTIAELVDKIGYLATPFTNHCLFVAASTLLQDATLPDTDHQQQLDSFFTLASKTDYEFLYQKLHDQGRYFGAINSIAAVLEQRQRALTNGGVNRATMNADDEDEDDDGAGRVVGLGDPGIVNRYTIPRPHITA